MWYFDHHEQPNASLLLPIKLNYFRHGLIIMINQSGLLIVAQQMKRTRLHNRKLNVD